MNVTIEQLAKQLTKKVGGDITPDKLLKQLQKAGVDVSTYDDEVNSEAQEKLLNMLKQQPTDDPTKPRKISLKRTQISKINVKGSTVNIVHKRRRVYVKREEQEEQPEDEIVAEPTLSEEVNKPQPTVKEEVTAKQPKEKESEAVEPAKTDKPKSSDGKRKKKGKSSKFDNEDFNEGKEHKKNKLRLMEEEGREVRRKIRSKPKVKKDFLGEEVNPHAFAKPTEPVIHEISIPETITVAELAKQMSVKSAELIKIMMKMGVMATINQAIDFDTATLIVEEMGHKVVSQDNISIEDSLNENLGTTKGNKPPIVTVMGHVDHGKTSLLDYIRSTRITQTESGGITQHIGAYQVSTSKGEITFLDTPGHSAFTAMRARGANCTDIVILVVAADDGVMPQTIEAIQHAKAAKVPIIVAINKIDKPEADVERVTNELSQHDLLPESWGGDTMYVKVSAKEGIGIDDLLEAVNLQAELLELSTITDGAAQGVVLEARVDRGRGVVASLLVQCGVLNKGDILLAGQEFGRIKAMYSDQGVLITSATSSVPVEVLGLSGTPKAGDQFNVVYDEKKAREVSSLRQTKTRDIKLSKQQSTKVDSFMAQMTKDNVKEVNIVLKADVQGSIEAIVDSVEKLSNDEIKVVVISKGVGGFNESDINLALASNAMLIGFNVRAEASARKIAQNESLTLNYYSVIYDVVDGVKATMEGKLGPKYTERIIGLAEVRDVFRSTKIGAIAGCMVVEGLIKRGNPIRVLRDNVVIYQGELESLRRFKENASEVRNGMECGIGVKNYNDVKVGDQIEVYEVIEVARGLN